MILKKFLNFGKSSLDDSYKLNSYKKESVICNGLEVSGDRPTNRQTERQTDRPTDRHRGL